MRLRKKYAQSEALAKAQSILQHLCRRGEHAMREEAIEAEINGWEELGVPIKTSPEAVEVIRGKYAPVAREASDA
jgi:hypothetical protein